MKTRMYFLAMLVAFAIMFVSCEEETTLPEEEQNNNEQIIPEKFGVDIPDAISQPDTKSSYVKSTAGDVISGEDIYGNLRYFIAIGESAAEIVEAIIHSIRVHHIQDVIELTYTSDDDGRIKRLVVEQNVDFENRTWEYMLTITDLESEAAADGGKAMQVFWNPNPVEGLAILKPYNIDRTNAREAHAMYAVEYSAIGNSNYEEYMVVDIDSISNDDSEDIFAVDNLKMFVGRNGDVVDVYGNSNHPMATFNSYNEKVGYNWAFVASGNETSDIAVAEVGLPYSDLDNESREVILVENSIKTVLTREITDYIINNEWEEHGVELDSAAVATVIAPYLFNADAPGYFNTNGFIQGGEAPSAAYADLEDRILTLTPYNPSYISALTISFK